MGIGARTYEATRNPGSVLRPHVQRRQSCSTAFPGCGTSDPADLAACLDERVECRVCLTLNEADELNRDCDLFDDGAANASCP